MKPNIDEFRDLMRKSGGNMTKAAQLLGVTRQTIWMWANSDDEYKGAMMDERKRVFDKCLDVAYAVAMGVPDINPVTNTMVGWKEKPDSNMLRYLLSTLGRDEGFGEKHDVNIENPIPTAINIVCSKPRARVSENDQ